MIRSTLSLLLCATALGVGLATAWLQCRNHSLADELDRAKRTEDLVNAEIEALEAGILVRAYGLEREWVEGPAPQQVAAAEPQEVPER